MTRPMRSPSIASTMARSRGATSERPVISSHAPPACGPPPPPPPPPFGDSCCRGDGGGGGAGSCCCGGRPVLRFRFPQVSVIWTCQDRRSAGGVVQALAGKRSLRHIRPRRLPLGLDRHQSRVGEKAVAGGAGASPRQRRGKRGLRGRVHLRVHLNALRWALVRDGRVVQPPPPRRQPLGRAGCERGPRDGRELRGRQPARVLAGGQTLAGQTQTARMGSGRAGNGALNIPSLEG